MMADFVFGIEPVHIAEAADLYAVAEDITEEEAAVIAANLTRRGHARLGRPAAGADHRLP